MNTAWVFLFIYTIALIFILFFSISQLDLTIKYWFRRRKSAAKLQNSLNIPLENWPKLTVQLPIYNEKYVVERLLSSCLKLDYPKDSFEIQILDDCTDETTDIVVDFLKNNDLQGITIHHIRREIRTGYKAGALKEALPLAIGEFICIFDADFIPEPDFFRKTIPFLVQNPEYGVVQTRWGHLNEDYSFITQLQAFALNAHFSIEQVGRNVSGYFINFNGTGGVWRKSCIIDAGNWEADTLTEDLDLSYRAQMRKWKFQYFEDIVCPAELPITMNELKAQQKRWTKGGAETAIKHLRNVWSTNMPTMVKIQASMHLLNSAIFLAFILAAVSSVPLLFMFDDTPKESQLLNIAFIFQLSMISLVLFYGTSFFSLSNKKYKILGFLYRFPLLLAMTMGLSLHNAIAVLEGYFGKKSPFIRTPKYSVTDKKDSSIWKMNSYRARKVSKLTWFEGLLTLYFASAVVFGVVNQHYELITLHFLITLGYFTIFFSSFIHASKDN